MTCVSDTWTNSTHYDVTSLKYGPNVLNELKGELERNGSVWFLTHRNAFDAPTMYEPEEDVFLRIMWWGLSKDPEYWHKRDALAKRLGKPEISWKLFHGKQLLRYDETFGSQSIPNVSIPKNLSEASNTPKNDMEALKRAKLYSLSRILPSGTFLNLPLESDLSGSLEEIPLTRFQKARGLLIETLAPVEPLGRHLQIIRPDGYDLTAMELFTGSGDHLEFGKDFRVVVNEARRALFVELLSNKPGSPVRVQG